MGALNRVVGARSPRHEITGGKPDQGITLLTLGGRAVAHQAFGLFERHPFDAHDFRVGGIEFAVKLRGKAGEVGVALIAGAGQQFAFEQA